MVIGGWRQKQIEVIELIDSFTQWLECFLKNPSEEVGHFFLTRLLNCWQISGTYSSSQIIKLKTSFMHT